MAEVLGDRKPDYLIISHLEPDHSANLGDVLAKYPDIKIVSNAKLFGMLPNFFEVPVADRSVTVAEGQTLSLGSHTLQFFMAPMVHWPEVMVTYEQSEKILFSADAFGKFGTLDTDEDWACEARRYYFNIVGKYGMPAQALLKIGKYQLWSTYTPEDEGIFIAYCSLHGNTEKAAKKLAEILEAKGAPKVAISELSRDDMAECIEDAFRYDRLVLAAPTYDGGVMPVMADFINHLKMKAYQKRKVAFIENGSQAHEGTDVSDEGYRDRGRARDHKVRVQAVGCGSTRSFGWKTVIRDKDNKHKVSLKPTYIRSYYSSNR